MTSAGRQGCNRQAAGSCGTTASSIHFYREVDGSSSWPSGITNSSWHWAIVMLWRLPVAENSLWVGMYAEWQLREQLEPLQLHIQVVLDPLPWQCSLIHCTQASDCTLYFKLPRHGIPQAPSQLWRSSAYIAASQSCCLSSYIFGSLIPTLVWISSSFPSTGGIRGPHLGEGFQWADQGWNNHVRLRIRRKGIPGSEVY